MARTIPENQQAQECEVTLFEGETICVIPAKGASKNLDTKDRIECDQPGHLHQELGSVDVRSAESAQEQSPGRKPRVGNSPLLADDSPDGASEKFSITRFPHPPAPSPSPDLSGEGDKRLLPVYGEGWGGGDIYFRGRL